MTTNGHLVIYDGGCEFCAHVVQAVGDRAGSHSEMQFVDSHSLSDHDLSELLLSRRDVENYLWVVCQRASKVATPVHRKQPHVVSAFSLPEERG